MDISSNLGATLILPGDLQVATPRQQVTQLRNQPQLLFSLLWLAQSRFANTHNKLCVGRAMPLCWPPPSTRMARWRGSLQVCCASWVVGRVAAFPCVWMGARMSLTGVPTVIKWSVHSGECRNVGVVVTGVGAGEVSSFLLTFGWHSHRHCQVISIYNRIL